MEKKESTTIHKIKEKAFDNSQQDQRVKKIVERLCGLGFVSKLEFTDRTYYEITSEGRKYYYNVLRDVREKFIR